LERDLAYQISEGVNLPSPFMSHLGTSWMSCFSAAESADIVSVKRIRESAAATINLGVIFIMDRESTLTVEKALPFGKSI
jgi:hypothetical protein